VTALARVAPFSTLGRWDAKPVFSSRQTDAALVRFGAVASRRREPNDGGLRYGSIHFDGSMTLRPAATELSGKTWVARTGDIVFSRIDARNGAIGVVPDEIEKLAFTSEFVIYAVDTPQLTRAFAKLLLRTPTIRAHLDALAVGHSGRKRLFPEAFEALAIPVLDGAEQRRIAEKHRAVMEEAATLRAKAQPLVAAATGRLLRELGIDYVRQPHPPLAFSVAFHALPRWSPRKGAEVAQGLTRVLAAAYPVVRLGDVAALRRGISKSPRNRPGRHATPYIRVANVQPGVVDLSDVQRLDVDPDRLDTARLLEGDVLVCRNNSLEWVGKAALWTGEIDPCVHDDHVFGLRCDRSRIEPEFLNAYLQTDFARAWFISEAQLTTNLAGIAGSAVTELPIPLPSLARQRSLGRLYREARETAAALRAEADALETVACDLVESAVALASRAG
jgi:type I restriction enzyme S subunit